MFFDLDFSSFFLTTQGLLISNIHKSASFPISRLPFFLKLIISQLIALLIYWPLASISLYLEKLGVEVKNIPLSFYRKCSLYTMRTDALDRFGTRLEKRFTKAEVIQMMHNAGLSRIIVSNSSPYYKAIGFKGLLLEE